jgi:AraC-like DNA-binding protein
MSVRVARRESELGVHEFAFGAATPLLRAQVHGYCGYVEHTPDRLRRRELPSGEVTLIVGFEQRLVVDGVTHDSFVAAMDETHSVTEFAGTSSGIEVNLTPFAARRMLGVPMHELANRVVRLEDVLGEDGRRLPERLADAESWEARFELLDAFIARRISTVPPPSPAVAYAWRRLIETDGRVGIGELAGELRCSRRYLVTQFREHVGLPPKRVARVLRFRRAFEELGRDDGRRFAEIAQDCGYYDQAHFNRELREFAGVAPSELIASRIPGDVGLAA